MMTNKNNIELCSILCICLFSFLLMLNEWYISRISPNPQPMKKCYEYTQSSIHHLNQSKNVKDERIGLVLMKRMEKNDHKSHSPPRLNEEENSPKVLKVIPTVKRLDEDENPENSILKELPLVLKEKSISPESSPNSSPERYARPGVKALKKKPRKSLMKNYNAPIDFKGKKVPKRVRFPIHQQGGGSKSFLIENESTQ